MSLIKKNQYIAFHVINFPFKTDILDNYINVIFTDKSFYSKIFMCFGMKEWDSTKHEGGI